MNSARPWCPPAVCGMRSSVVGTGSRPRFNAELQQHGESRGKQQQQQRIISLAMDDQHENVGTSKDDADNDRCTQALEGSYVKRSDLIAKQVITVSDALSIGFVSELWIDSRKWDVKALELKPSFLFGEVEGVFLSSLLQIGDVVLLEDAECLQGDLRLPSFDTVIGCDLVTEAGLHLGKVRDYVFNTRSGEITFLEFDSLGFSLVPASMISTYSLEVEDVVETSADSFLVRAGAENRVRRLTKGLLHFPRKRTQKPLRRTPRQQGSSYMIREQQRSREKLEFNDEKQYQADIYDTRGARPIDTFMRYRSDELKEMQ